ncbi:MAG: EAL domain-containing protein [bacterium]
MGADPRDGGVATPRYSYAFQPIIDTVAGEILSFEALIRGERGEGAGHVFSQVSAETLAEFDRDSRAFAVGLAGRLGISCSLNLNAMPGSLRGDDGGLDALVSAARQGGVPLDRLILEITEREAIVDYEQFAAVMDGYRAAGIKVAIDDMGAGYSGLNLLADFQPDMLKLDMHLVRGIESRGPRQSIVRALVMVCGDLGIDVVAEGVETVDELQWFESEGVRLFQGYLFGKPAFEHLVHLDEVLSVR